MIKVEEKKDVVPLCPHCKNEIINIFFREIESQFGRRYIYFCPKCRSVVGISHRKGFWMG